MVLRLAIGLIALLALIPLPAHAADPSPAYRARAQQFVTILSQPGGEEAFFSSLFLDAVPTDRWRALALGLRQAHGRPLSLGAISVESATAGQVEVRYERATVGFTLVVAPQPPHLIVGLHIVGARVADDSMGKVLADLTALPGRTAFAAARLGEGAPRLLHALHPDTQMATGSTYKLYILAELARSIGAGERHWRDVVPLTHKSFSGRLMAWPDKAPLTLHSLATAMIAESDNSAADTLLLALGRGRVDQMVETTGHSDAGKTLPLLTTAEAFALKMPGASDLRSTYARAPLAARRALLAENAARLSADRVDVGSVAERPAFIDSIEWFASPTDTIRLLDWLRQKGGDALPLMAVNPGIARADAQRWRYLGYKGGSEPGVMAMSFLAQAKDGRFYAISGSWNNISARLDEPRFVAIMTRALNLLADAKP